MRISFILHVSRMLVLMKLLLSDLRMFAAETYDFLLPELILAAFRGKFGHKLVSRKCFQAILYLK